MQLKIENILSSEIFVESEKEADEGLHYLIITSYGNITQKFKSVQQKGRQIYE